jgi:hypothetical protein
MASAKLSNSDASSVTALYEQVNLIDDCSDLSDEYESYIRIIEEGVTVNNRLALLKWLQGEIQLYMPHEIMLALWFHDDRLRHDLISGLPVIRTKYLQPDALLKLQRIFYERWMRLGKMPFRVNLKDLGAVDNFSFSCVFGKTIYGMRSVLVHGVSDLRSRQDCLYMAFSSSTSSSSLAAMVTFLPYLDIALR